MINKVSTGFASIDNLLQGGFNKGELVLIAARPAIGKTSFILSLIDKLVNDGGKKIALFSLEESEAQIKRRLYCIRENVKGALFYNQKDKNQIASAHFDKRYSNICLDDSPALQINEICEKIADVIENKDVRIVFIDYLQLISTDGKIERQYEIKDITKKLKEFASKYNVPIVVNAVLSRHFNTIPTLDAEDIEHCIDTEIPDKILFLHRPAYYKRIAGANDINVRQDVQVRLAKNNNGNIGCITIPFVSDFSKFDDIII